MFPLTSTTATTAAVGTFSSTGIFGFKTDTVYSDDSKNTTGIGGNHFGPLLPRAHQLGPAGAQHVLRRDGLLRRQLRFPGQRLHHQQHPPGDDAAGADGHSGRRHEQWRFAAMGGRFVRHARGVQRLPQLHSNQWLHAADEHADHRSQLPRHHRPGRAVDVLPDHGRRLVDEARVARRDRSRHHAGAAPRPTRSPASTSARTSPAARPSSPPAATTTSPPAGRVWAQPRPATASASCTRRRPATST